MRECIVARVYFGGNYFLWGELGGVVARRIIFVIRLVFTNNF